MTTTNTKTPIPWNISSDAEFFIRNKETGNIVSSIPIVKNTKEKPIDLGDGYATYCDNVSIEATLPVADSREGFVNVIQTAINKINNFLGKKYEAVTIAAHKFPDSELKDEGANEIGCSSFFIARSLCIAEPPTLPEGYRSAGFHLHIGRPDFKKHLDNPADNEWIIDPMSKINLVNLMDIFVGIPSVIFDNSPASRSRKEIYTQTCGAHRIPPYGIEYRPLSSNCMRHPDLIGLIFDLTSLAIKASQDGTEFDVTDEEAFQCIDNHDVELSLKVMGRTLPKNMIERIIKFAE